MITPLPQVGDIVDVTIKGIRVTHIEPAMLGFGAAVYAAIPKATGNDNSMLIPADSPTITIVVTEPAKPSAWPPRLGDLWRDKDGSLWFATTAHVYQHGPGGDFPAVPVVELVHAGGGPSLKPEEVNREFGPLELVRREDTADSAPPVQGVWPPRAGEVWKDRDGDHWTAIHTPDGVEMHECGGVGVLTVHEVRQSWGPLTFVRREQPGDGS